MTSIWKQEMTSYPDDGVHTETSRSQVRDSLFFSFPLLFIPCSIIIEPLLIIHAISSTGRDRSQAHKVTGHQPTMPAQNPQPVRSRFIPRPTPHVTPITVHLPRRFPPLVNLLGVTRIRPPRYRFGWGDEASSDRDRLFLSTPFWGVLWRTSSGSRSAPPPHIREHHVARHPLWGSFETWWRVKRVGEEGMGEGG